MMEKLLNVEGPVMTFLNKTGQLICLSVLWLICCIGVITIPAATTALYYAVMKSVRRDTGSAGKEFFRSFRANLLRGMGAGLPVWGLMAVLVMNLRFLGETGGSNLLRWGTLILLVLLAAAGCCICPILSRFTMKVTDVWKLAFVMGVRFLPFTALILLGALLGAAAQFYLLPIPALAILPGGMCLLATFPMEKALGHYMPPKEENDTSWYYT